jgi:hypothetical protein
LPGPNGYNTDVLKVLFWNLGRRSSLSLLVALAKEHSPDVVILAESPQPEVAVVEALNLGGDRLYNQTLNFSNRLQFFVGFSPEGFAPLSDDAGISARRVVPPIGCEIVLVAVHLGSKRHLSNDDQGQLAPRMREVVDDSERKVGHGRTVLIGDFNMNPFEVGMISSEGVHGLMSRAIANKGSRKVQGTRRSFFYNPMWSLFGDNSPGPPGSYYYPVSKPYSLYWNMFDQILLRPELALDFEPGDVGVLQRAGDRTLITCDGVPDRSISDHLPLLATIRNKEVFNGIGESLG